MKVGISVKAIKMLTATYLVVPFLIFFLFWLKPLYGVSLSLTLVYCFYKFHKNIEDKTIIEIPVFYGLLTFFILATWVGISGNGAMGVQWNDLIKPVAISKDIITNGQPIVYHHAEGDTFLCQYLGLYVTIPTIFAFLSWEGVMLATYFYVLLGVLLGTIWFFKHIESFSPIWALFFVFFCGIDFAGFAYSLGLKNAVNSLLSNFFAYQAFWGNTLPDPNLKLLYQSNTHALFWGPQHALASWIGMGIFFYDFKQKKELPNSIFYLALLVFWSPFIVLAIFPFLLLSLNRAKFWSFFTIQNILMIPIVLVVVWYMSSLPLQEIKSGLLFYKSSLSGYFQQLKAFGVFWLADVGLWLVPCVIILIKQENDGFLALTTLILLTFIPLYTFGTYNDWSQRVSMPGLFLTSIFVVKAFKATSRKLIVGCYFFVIFVLGSWDPVYFITHSLKFTHYKPFSFQPLPFDKTPTYYEACLMSRYPIYQNVAPTSASFYQIMCKKK